MGLMAAGDVTSDSVRRGLAYLLDTQNAQGTWEENTFTGTGFPKVFYLKYHLYAKYFPVFALGTYARQMELIQS
jgi:squalene-hopene/tetraprenyl-beta-curcumene cyclase